MRPANYGFRKLPASPDFLEDLGKAQFRDTGKKRVASYNQKSEIAIWVAERLLRLDTPARELHRLLCRQGRRASATGREFEVVAEDFSALVVGDRSGGASIGKSKR